MNLIEFIKFLRNNDELVQYMNENYPDVDYYDAEVYLKGSLNVESELIIFNSDKIEGLIEMEVKNEKYINLFSLDLLAEVFEDYSKGSGTDHDIAARIINYRINDA